MLNLYSGQKTSATKFHKAQTWTITLDWGWRQQITTPTSPEHASKAPQHATNNTASAYAEPDAERAARCTWQQFKNRQSQKKPAYTSHKPYHKSSW
jgi:hypothetical protein